MGKILWFERKNWIGGKGGGNIDGAPLFLGVSLSIVIEKNVSQSWKKFKDDAYKFFILLLSVICCLFFRSCSTKINPAVV